MNKFLHEEEFVEVGYIRKSYGYKGDVKANVTPAFVEDLEESKFVFINQRGLKVPFKILELSLEGDLLIKFDYLNSSEEAAVIVGQAMFMLKKDIKHAHDYISSNQENSELEGFSLIDELTNQAFEILRLEEFPQQLMAIVLQDDEEKYIPLNDQFIIEINKEKKEIIMDLPEGLLDL